MQKSRRKRESDAPALDTNGLGAGGKGKQGMLKKNNSFRSQPLAAMFATLKRLCLRVEVGRADRVVFVVLTVILPNTQP